MNQNILLFLFLSLLFTSLQADPCKCDIREYWNEESWTCIEPENINHIIHCIYYQKTNNKIKCLTCAENYYLEQHN